MSRSKVVDGRFLKWVVIVNALVPAVMLVIDGVRGTLGVNAVNFLIRTTGMLGLVFLVLSLLVTPLRRITGWSVVIAPRRQLGLFGFFYIAAHFAIFWLYDRAGSIADTLTEIIERPYLWFGAGALLLMVPLAITSLDGMVTRLGAKRWKLLHRLNYVIVPAGVVHYYLLVKSDVRQPVAFGVVVGASLLVRAGWHYVDLHRAAHRPQPVVKKKFWSGELVVARIFDETHDVKTFRFTMPDGSALPFQHVAGQYLNLALLIDGKRVNRSYTIASSPTRSHYVEISVKRVGYASTFLHEHVRQGDRIKVGAPAGKFVFAGHEAERIVLIAGGVGITPMMAVARSLTDRCWRGEIYLLFGVREARDVIFAKELAHLQERFPNLHVEIVASSERGRITAEIIKRFVPDLSGPIMLCGPDAMMTAMRGILVGELGVPDAQVTQEAFASPLQVVGDVAAAVGVAADGPASVEFRKTGTTGDATDLTVLEAAEACGVAIPFECRSGICGQCKTKVVAGRVTMEVQDALTAADRSKGLILACQARPAGDIVVDA